MPSFFLFYHCVFPELPVYNMHDQKSMALQWLPGSTIYTAVAQRCKISCPQTPTALTVQHSLSVHHCTERCKWLWKLSALCRWPPISWTVAVCVRVKVKVTPWVAQKRSRSTAVLILDLSGRWGQVVTLMSQSLYPHERVPVPIAQHCTLLDGYGENFLLSSWFEPLTGQPVPSHYTLRLLFGTLR